MSKLKCVFLRLVLIVYVGMLLKDGHIDTLKIKFKSIVELGTKHLLYYLIYYLLYYLYSKLIRKYIEIFDS